MKRMLVLLAACSGICLLNIITVLVLAGLAGIRIGVAGPVGGTCEVGDVNGDGTIDVSDPVGLLGYLFANGPAPVACAQDPLDLSQLEGVLAKFWPRAGDLVFVKETLPPLTTEDLFTVPVGRVFVLTFFRAGTQLTLGRALVNGTPAWEHYPWISAIPATGGGPTRLVTQFPVVIPLQPGDVLSLENFQPSISVTFELHGYWADL